MFFQYANRAKTLLATSISKSITTIVVESGTGALFPALTQPGEAFPVTIISVADQSIFEICYVTQRNTDTFTVIRAQENTNAQAFVSGDIVSLNMTAKIFNLFPQAGYLGVYDPDVVNTIGGYKKNAILADPQVPTQLWISLKDDNRTPPGDQTTGWWSSVNFSELGIRLNEFVSGRLGLRPNDTQGISLLTNGDTGQAHYKDNSGKSWDLAPQNYVDNVNADLQALKTDAVRGHGYNSGDNRIPNIWANNNSDRQRLQANVEGRHDITTACIEDVQDEKNRAVATENNINNDLQNFKSTQAIISAPYSSYDTRITHARIMHDQPHPHVAIEGEDSRYDHSLANLADIQDTNNALNAFKQDAVISHGYSNGDNRTPNIWANNNSDRQRLQANVEGRGDITTACIEDVWDERNRAIQDVTNERNRAIQDVANERNRALAAEATFVQSVPGRSDTRIDNVVWNHDAQQYEFYVEGIGWKQLYPIEQTAKALIYSDADARPTTIRTLKNGFGGHPQLIVQNDGSDDFNGASIQSVQDETNRAINVENDKISGSWGMGPGDIPGRGLHTNIKTGRANYWDDTKSSRGDLAYYDDIAKTFPGVKRIQSFWQIAKNGDTINFSKQLLDLQFSGTGNARIPNVTINMSVMGSAHIGYHFNVWGAYVDWDDNTGELILDENGFKLLLISHGLKDSDVGAGHEGNSLRVAVTVYEY